MIWDWQAAVLRVGETAEITFFFNLASESLEVGFLVFRIGNEELARKARGFSDLRASGGKWMAIRKLGWRPENHGFWAAGKSTAGDAWASGQVVRLAGGL